MPHDHPPPVAVPAVVRPPAVSKETKASSAAAAQQIKQQIKDAGPPAMKQRGCEVSCWFDGQKMKVFHPIEGPITPAERKHACRYTHGSCICICL